MSKNYILNACLRLGAGTLVLGLVGCSSTGPSRSAKTVDSMEETHQRLTDVRRQIDKTQGSLDAVMGAKPDDLRSSFSDYAKNVDKLTQDAKATKARFKSMKSNKETYLAAWEKQKGQVNDPELRRIGDARRSQMKEGLDRVVDSLNVATNTFDPFLSNLVDVRKILGSDLTATGQALVATSTVVQSSRENGARVARSIDTALASISDVAGQISSTGEMK